MQNHKATQNFKLACALLSLLAAVLALNTSSFTPAQAATVQTAELKSATEAKRTLARLGTPNFARIKDARKRDAAQKGYDAIKALANNTSKEREPALATELARTTQVLKAFPRPTKPRSFEQDCDNRYKTCMELCAGSNGHGNCDLCAMSNNMCYQLGIFKEFYDENAEHGQ